MLKYAYAALVCAVGTGLCPAVAQEAPTAGADVTADEASPLPPIVVTSPSEPIAKPSKKAATPSSGGPGAVAGASEAKEEAPPGPAVVGTGAGAVGVYTLGQLDVIGGSTITNQAMWTFNKNSLDQAVNILPGVSVQSSGNSRNEKVIFVRGFDQFRVPLYMDGVRIYLPADNRLDFARFLTPDLAEVQVQKGYVSVLNGAGGMGGAINLVSRKPTKAVELEGRSGITFNGDLDDMNQWSSYAYAGTRQSGYYAQVSGTIVDQDHFNLSDDFTPASAAATPGYLAGFPYENGGDRDHSNFEDWRINAKVGITPNATDEYSINYTTQKSEKGAPLHVNRQVVLGYFFGANERHWTWDNWDISTLSWLSKTQLGDASYIKTNVYYNTFDNTLFFHNNRSYTTRIIDSVYEDHNTGGFVELGTELIPMNTLKGALHYRNDVHNEFDLDYDTTVGPFLGRTPTETSQEETWSIAVENTFHATPLLDFVTGVSYERNRVLEAEFADSAGDVLPTPVIVIKDQPEQPTVDAWNWQGAAILSYSATGKAHADVSSRTRFPTLFDRYSTRFGTRTVNPNLDPERATNYEIGASDTLWRDLKLSGAVFYSDIEDSIQNAFYAANGNNSIIGFNADGEYYGFELSADLNVMPTLRLGGNYTYLERDFDYLKASQEITPFAPTANTPAAIQTAADLTAAARGSVAAYQAEGTPTHKAFLYASWDATPKLTLTPSLELASDRTVLITDCRSTLVRPGNAQTSGQCNPPARSQAQTRPNFTDIGAYAVVNFRADYTFTENFEAAIGVTNLFDENYSLADGFPEPGRQFYVTARAKF